MNREQTINNHILPELFSGTSTESVQNFIRKFNKYADHRGWNADQRLRSVPIYLAGAAEIWYRKLADAERPANFDEFVTLIERHFDNTSARLIGTQKFNQLRQKPDEPVDKFSARLLELADTLNLTEEAMSSQFLTGLKPEIKTQVLSHNPTTLGEATTKVILAETALISVPTGTDEKRDASLQYLEGQITVLKGMLEKTQITQPDTQSDVPNRIADRGYQNQTQWQQQSVPQQTNFQPRRFQRSTPQRQQQNGRRQQTGGQMNAQGRRTNYNNRQNFENFSNGNGRDFSNSSEGNRPRFNSYGNNSSQNFSMRCHYCGKPGHFMKDCRARLQQTRFQEPFLNDNRG